MSTVENKTPKVIDLVDFMDIDKSLVHAYLYLYPYQLKSKEPKRVSYNETFDTNFIRENQLQLAIEEITNFNNEISKLINKLTLIETKVNNILNDTIKPFITSNKKNTAITTQIAEIELIVEKMNNSGYKDSKVVEVAVTSPLIIQNIKGLLEITNKIAGYDEEKIRPKFNIFNTLQKSFDDFYLILTGEDVQSETYKLFSNANNSTNAVISNPARNTFMIKYDVDILIYKEIANFYGTKIKALAGDEDIDNILSSPITKEKIDISNTQLQIKIENIKNNSSNQIQVSKYVPEFYIKLPIFDKTITNDFGYSWEDYDVGQIDPNTVIAGKTAKAGFNVLTKMGETAVEEVQKNLNKVGATPVSSAVRVIGEGGKELLNQVGEMLGDEQVKNAIQQRMGRALVTPKKKIFKGTDIKTFSYKLDTIIPKDMKSHLAIINTMKLIQIMITPAQGSFNFLNSVAVLVDSIVGSVVGKKSGQLAQYNVGQISQVNALDVALDMYALTMTYPYTFEGIIKTNNPKIENFDEDNNLGLGGTILRFFPESAVTKYSTSLDLEGAFYDESNLPQTLSFSLDFTELIPFHQGTALFSPDTVERNLSIVTKQIESNVTDENAQRALTVYKNTFSIL